MSDIIILDNEYITMKYLAARNAIYHQVHQPINGQLLREAMIKAFAVMQEYGATKWISDDRKNGPIASDDLDWGMDNWNNGVVDVNWKYWAVIVPEEIAAASSMGASLEAMYEHGLRMMVFTDEAEAFAWIDGFAD